MSRSAILRNKGCGDQSARELTAWQRVWAMQRGHGRRACLRKLEWLSHGQQYAWPLPPNSFCHFQRNWRLCQNILLPMEPNLEFYWRHVLDFCSALNKLSKGTLYRFTVSTPNQKYLSYLPNLRNLLAVVQILAKLPYIVNQRRTTVNQADCSHTSHHPSEPCTPVPPPWYLTSRKLPSVKGKGKTSGNKGHHL